MAKRIYKDPVTGEWIEEDVDDDSLFYDFDYGDQTPTVELPEVEFPEVRDTMLRPGDPYYSDTTEEIQDWQNVEGGGNLDNWKYENGVWTDPSGKEYDLSYLNIKDKTALSRFLGYAKKLLGGKGSIEDYMQLLPFLGGLLGAGRSSDPTILNPGYTGGIPQVAATRTMLTEPPAGRRPGSGGINYGGDVTYARTGQNLTPENAGISAPVSQPLGGSGTSGGGYGSAGQITDIASLLAMLQELQAAGAGSGGSGGGSGGTGGGGGVATPTTPTTTTGPRPPSGFVTGPTTVVGPGGGEDFRISGGTVAEGYSRNYTPEQRIGINKAFTRSQQDASYGVPGLLKDMEKTGVTAKDIALSFGIDQNSLNQYLIRGGADPSFGGIDAGWDREKQAEFIRWQAQQPNPFGTGTIGDNWAKQGITDPVNDPLLQAMAQEQLGRFDRRNELLSGAGAPTVSPPTPAPAPAPSTKPSYVGDIQSWYAANEGKGTQADLDRWLATSGFTAQQINEALPQWGVADLQNAITSAQQRIQSPAPAPAPAPVYEAPAPAPAPSYVSDIQSWYAANDGKGTQADLDRWLATSGFSAQQINEALPQWGVADLQNAITGAQQRIAAPAGGYGNEPAYLEAAKGGLLPDGFVIPADVVSHLGNGSSEAGLELLAEELGAKPIKGEGDGMSDSIPTTIGGNQPARVANEEAFVPPEVVKRLGNGDTERGAKKLYAMMDRIRKARTGTTEQGKQINPEKFMPGGKVERYQTGGTTNPTSGGSSLAEWVGPYVADMLGKGQALSEMPYTAYTGPLTAGASPLQQQAFGTAAGLQTPAQFGQAAGIAGAAGQRALDVGYTPVGQSITGGPLSQPISGAPTSAVPSMTGTQPVSNIAQAYMNPYLESVLNPQLRELTRQADITRAADAARMAKAGAFGGSRQAIMESEGRRNLMQQQSDVLGQGYATAYDKALAQFNAEQARKIAEAQFGTTTGLEGIRTGLQGAQVLGQLGSQQQQSTIDNLRALAEAGATQRAIEAEGIAADKAQFEEARLNPYKMLQFQQSLLSGLPLAAQSMYMPGTSNLDQFAGGFSTVAKLLSYFYPNLFKNQPATTPPKAS